MYRCSWLATWDRIELPYQGNHRQRKLIPFLTTDCLQFFIQRKNLVKFPPYMLACLLVVSLCSFYLSFHTAEISVMQLLWRDQKTLSCSRYSGLLANRALHPCLLQFPLSLRYRVVLQMHQFGVDTPQPPYFLCILPVINLCNDLHLLQKEAFFIKRIIYYTSLWV